MHSVTVGDGIKTWRPLMLPYRQRKDGDVAASRADYYHATQKQSAITPHLATRG